VIKLLKSFYAVTEDQKQRIDICVRLIFRLNDEDDSVKDLALKSLEELWFPALTMQKLRSGPSVSTDDRSELLSKVAVIMGSAANFRDRQSPVEDLLHRIMSSKEGSEAEVLHKRYAEICETLIDGLVDATNLPGFVSGLNRTTMMMS
jgi:cohesin loading factor subunit SCC2